MSRQGTEAVPARAQLCAHQGTATVPGRAQRRAHYFQFRSVTMGDLRDRRVMEISPALSRQSRVDNFTFRLAPSAPNLPLGSVNVLLLCCHAR